MRLSVPQLASKLQTEADAYKLLEDLRWPRGEPVCPHCGSVGKHYFLTPKNGTARKTRTGSMSQRRVWKCADCRKQFSVLTGTIFGGSKVPVRTWVFVLFEMASSESGVSAREIERKYDLALKTAWLMMHRIREAMKREPMASLLSGRVSADRATGLASGTATANDPRKHVQGRSDKFPILALGYRKTGEVRSRVMPDVKPGNLRSAIQGQGEWPPRRIYIPNRRVTTGS
jgi:transposase-like protein